MTPQRAIPWAPMIGAVAVMAGLAAVVVWCGSLAQFDRKILQTRAGLKKQTLSGHIRPTQDVMDYLSHERQKTLETRYHQWLERVTAPPVADAGADPQLAFQEQAHEVQRMLEQRASARGMTVPEQLGFPKEVPPPETVPRLLAELALIKEATALMFEQGLISLNAFKVEDPEVVTEAEEAKPFLTRLPLRVRLTASLPQLMRILAALQHTDHLIDVRLIRMAAGESPDRLNIELVLARYLLAPGAADLTPSADTSAPRGASSRKRREPSDQR